MADDVDITTARAEAEAPRLIVASRKCTPPPPTGRCLYCDAQLADIEQHFCDAECARAWEYEQDRRRANGSLR